MSRGLAFCLLLAATFASSASASSQPAPPRRDHAPEAALAQAIAALSPRVEHTEARRVAARAWRSSQSLAHEYRVVGHPLFHNFLVNTGLRNRGLCYQWAQDLGLQLRKLPLATLQLHWGEARAGTLREHNCVVVTARGQLFAEGLVLDAWRRSGQLVWVPVRADHYPWREAPMPPWLRTSARTR